MPFVNLPQEVLTSPSVKESLSIIQGLDTSEKPTVPIAQPETGMYSPETPQIKGGQFIDLNSPERVQGILETVARRTGAFDLYQGFKLSQVSADRYTANLTAMANDFVETLGLGRQESLTALENFLQNQSEKTLQEVEFTPGFLSDLYRAIGSAPGAIAQYGIGTKLLGPTVGFAATEFVQNYDKGYQEATSEAIKAAFIGRILGGTSELKRPSRIGTAATIGALSSAGEGLVHGDLSVENIALNAITLGGLSAFGGRGRYGIREIRAPIDPKLQAFLERPPITVQEPFPEYAYNIRVDKFIIPEQAKQLIRDNAKMFDDMYKLPPGEFTQIARGAFRAISDNPELEDEFIRLVNSGQKELFEWAIIGRAALARSAMDAEFMKIKFQEEINTLGAPSIDTLATTGMLIERHGQIQDAMHNFTAQIGRGLRQFREPIIDPELNRMSEVMAKLANDPTYKDHIEKATFLLSMTDSAEAIEAYLSKETTRKITTGDKLVEGWINALLSNPTTWVVNVSSGALTSLWAPVEQAMAGVIGKTHGGEKVYIQEALGMIPGMIHGSYIGAKMAASAFKTESFRQGKVETVQKAIGGKTGRVIRTPGNILMAGDVMFKMIGRYQEVYAQGTRLAVKNKIPISERMNYVNDFQKFIFDPQKYPDLARKFNMSEKDAEDIMAKAITRGNYQTFTKELGRTGKAMQDFVDSHKALRLVFPFVRTPINIMKFAGERLAAPLPFVSKNVRQTISKGGPEADLQNAKWILGTGIGITAAMLASQGYITGGGPPDHAEKGMLYATGWQPYSVFIGDKYYAYNRVEPLGILMGISADSANVIDKASRDDAEQMSARIVFALTQNITSKTWLEGVDNLFAALREPERYGPRFIQGYAGSLLAPSGVAAWARIEDPTLKDVRGIVDAVNARTPKIISEMFPPPFRFRDLHPRVDIWGNIINFERPTKLSGLAGDLLNDQQKKVLNILENIVDPIYESTVAKDPVAHEAVALGVVLQPAQRDINDVKLDDLGEVGQQIYYQYASESGKLAHDVMSIVYTSPEWQKLGIKGQAKFIKTKVYKEVMRQAREAVRAKLMAQYPEILKKKSEDIRKELSGEE